MFFVKLFYVPMYYCDMVMCELRVVHASYELHLLCELRVTSYMEVASGKLKVRIAQILLVGFSVAVIFSSCTKFSHML